MAARLIIHHPGGAPVNARGSRAEAVGGRGQSNAGGGAFTLLEVMLAIAIFTGVMVAIYATWTSILRSAQVAQTAAAEVHRSRMAMRALEEAMLGARIPMLRAQPGRLSENHYSFLAQNDPDDPILSFVARLPESFPRSGRFGEMAVRRVTFSLEPDRMRRNQLVLRQVPVLFEPDLDEEENPLVLATDVRVFSFEFWDARNEEWTDEWTVTNRVPPLIRLNLEVQSSDAGRSEPQRWTSKVVPLAASGALVGVRSAVQPPVPEAGNPPGGAPPPEPPQEP